MSRRLIITGPSRVKMACGFLIALGMSNCVRAQEEVRAYRKVAFESGHNTLTIKTAPGGKYYALNRDDRCVRIYSSPESVLMGQISSVGMGPSDLLLPRDLAVDRDGNAIVADASDMIKVFSSGGKLLRSFPFKRPRHVGVLSDGRILVSGFPRDYLISVFDRQGKSLGAIGTPAKVDERSFPNAVMNVGQIVTDNKNNIYYVFQYLLTPTVRKYSSDGTLIAEWHVEGGDQLAKTVERANTKYQSQKDRVGAFGGVEVFTGASFDEDSGTLWVASGGLLIQLDSSGRTSRTFKLVSPDGRSGVAADGLIFDHEFMRASFWSGVFEFPRP